MLIVRLQPMGRKHRKHYRLVVAQKHRHVTKMAVEILGWFNPYTKTGHVNTDRVNHYKSLNTEFSKTAEHVISKLQKSA